MATPALSAYNKKRNFTITAEPKGKAGKKKQKNLEFVIQWHHATRTHYDFRLECEGVMKSWAVTRGPSYHPEDKRLAVRTEDHPMEYNKFEGVIPEKQYGAGPVMIWDHGTWVPDMDPVKAEKKGHISFTIYGERMKGHWHLVRMHTKEKRENWLLIKGDDEYALTKAKAEKFLKDEQTSMISGRSIDEISQKKTEKTKPAKSSKKKDLKSINKLSAKIASPQLATLVDAPPSGDKWIHEIKYDGYRLIAFVDNGNIVLRTRGGKDWTVKFQSIADALSKLPVKNAVLDCEACVTDEKGRTNFGLLQQALTDGEDTKIEAWIFDLLYLDNKDLRREKLSERKKQLKKLLNKASAPLHYSEHFTSNPDLLSHACKIGAEGLVSKKLDSLYAGKRTKDWLKSKCNLEQEFVIGGFMPAKDEPKAVGALLLGYYKNKKFHYAGKVGTGFTRKTAKDIYKKLHPLVTDRSPFVDEVEKSRRKHLFIKPEILCEITFLEWTREGHIRHSVFKGLREDKSPKEVVEEKPVKTKSRSGDKQETGLKDIKITHSERVVFPDSGVTKGQIAEYYASVSKLILPYLQDRFTSLLRCTDGIKGQCFFQRNPMKGLGAAVKSKKLTHKGKTHEYIFIQDEQGLLQLAQMGTIEFHTWQSTVQKNNLPTQIIFDLDPDETVPFDAVKLAALDIHGRLKKLGLTSFARLSGGKGIHVVVPVLTEHKWDAIKEWARAFAEDMARDVPEAYVANMSKKRRTGKIFIDFFRNDFSATAVAPFSLRARDGAKLAWPVSWAALKKTRSAGDFTLPTLTKAQINTAAKISDEFLKTRQKLSL